jgi:hypothetical protein
MSARIEVIERIEDNAEALEPGDVETRILDVVVMRFDLDVRVEPACRLLRDLGYGC